MNPKYPRGAWSVRRRVALVVMSFMGVIVGAAGLLVYIDMQQNGSATVQGTSQTIVQAASADNKKLFVSDPLFELELPGDWKEISRQNSVTERSITWQATKKDYDNRTLKLYIDKIPANIAVNKILPVTVTGTQLLPGDMSDNCITFTSGGTMNPDAGKGHDKPAKWMGVDFICEMGTTIDNQIGVGSTAGVNQISVKGSKETHKYFFVYADRNIRPDSSILKDALSSFKAK
jgi:hypothetical protein